ncbi:MAG TPA: cellulose binding domain-containing protein [Rugosimonospora sp.]|nr:cellulose binding domain-containing protein [Rugosimonospora sp.]
MTRRFLRPVLAIAVTALLLAGAVAAAAAPVPAQAASPLIVITNFSFTGDLAVSPGVTVTVRNDDAVMHTLTAVDGSFTTPVIQPGTSATFVAPSTPGSYAVTCQIHSFMSGTLVVAPASPTPAVSPSASGPAAPLIVITNFTYTGDLTVPPGVTVTVRNADPVIHTLTAVDGSFTTPVIQPGTTATFVAPSTPGNHAIKCKIHSFMSGTLVVATGGSPSASPSTSGNVSAEPPTSGSFSVTRGGCAAMFTVVSRWAGGFQAAVMVMNGPAPRSSWTVSWTFPSSRTLTHLWNGTVSQSGATVTVHNASFNGALAPNASTEFGLLGSWHPSNSEPVALTCQ